MFAIICYKQVSAVVRTDQVVPKGSYAYANDNQGRIVLCYNDANANRKCLNYVYANDENEFGLCYLIPGAITNTLCANFMPGAFWVQNPRYFLRKTSIEICNSSANFFWIAERCLKIEDGTSQTQYVGGIFTNISAKVFDFDYVNTGAIDNGYSTNGYYKHVNGAGYVYGLYSNDCPYNNSDKNCSATNYIKNNPNLSQPTPYSIDDNCYMVKDFLRKGCAPESACPCTDEEGKNNICDENFLPKSIDRTATNIADVDVKTSCYACNSSARLAYHQCSSNAKDVYGQALALFKGDDVNISHMISTLYGRGRYICGFIGYTSPYRAGCAKIPLNVPPRPFPRIARADPSFNVITYPAAQLFKTVARVLQFRNVSTSEGSIIGDRCNFGQAELGEEYRGTFFRPKIKIRFGATEKVINFKIKDTSDMTLTYGETTYDSDSQSYIKNLGIIASPWNNEYPVILHYSQHSDATCAISAINTDMSTGICTRLEYDDSRQMGFYVAYQNNNPIGSHDSVTCEQLFNNDELILIGSVPRPPLKYRYNDNGKIVVPLSVQSDRNSGDAVFVSNIIRVDPQLVATEMQYYHSEIKPMSASAIADYYNFAAAPDHTSGEISDKSGGVTMIKKSCVMLFGQKFCIKRNLCNTLTNASSIYINMPKSICVSNECKKIQQIAEQCQSELFCPLDSGDLASCKKDNNIIIPLTENLSDYHKNIAWNDESCINVGFQFAHDVSDSNAAIQYTNSELFGSYGDINRDFVFAYTPNTKFPNVMRKAFRNNDFNNEDRVDNFVTMPNNFINASMTDMTSYLKSLPYDSGDTTIYKQYLGSDCDDVCAKNTMYVRHKTIREMGICVINDTNMSNFGTISDVVQDFYIPYKCQFLEFQLAGGGGGGMWAQSGWVGENNGWESGGSAGAYVAGIIDARVHDEEYLSMHIGRGAKIPMDGSHCSSINSGAYGGATSSYIDSPVQAGYRYATAGAGFCNAEQCKKWEAMPGGTPSFDSSSVLANFTDNSAMISSWNNVGDVYGDGSFITQAMQGNSMYVGYSGGIRNGASNYLGQHPDCSVDDAWVNNTFVASGGCMEDSWTHGRAGVGGDGMGSLSVASVELDSNSNPTLSGYNKKLYAGKPDPDCLISCPRMNIKLNVDGNAMICEYGAVKYGANGMISSAANNGMQIPESIVGMPSKCVTSDGGIVFPNTSYSVVHCSNNVVTDNNRFHGLCATSKDRENYIREMLLNSTNFFSGGGVYCDDKFSCPSANVINAKYSSSLTKISLFGRKCLSGGFWSKLSGGIGGEPIKRIGGGELQYMCPAINPSKVAYDHEFSLNAIWPEANGGSTVIATGCMNGYIPKNSSKFNLSRECDMNGIWRGWSSDNVDVCLLTCPVDKDTNNFIVWNPPTDYSNLVSLPQCLSGSMQVYKNGVLSSNNVQYMFPAGTNAQDFARTCNMPTAANPSLYGGVGRTITPSLMPYWDAAKKNAMCVPPSFTGQCMRDRHVCYDAGGLNDIVPGWCQANYVYTVNGIISNPPSMQVGSYNKVSDISLNSVNIDTNKSFYRCAINQDQHPDSIVFMNYNASVTNTNFVCSNLSRGAIIDYNLSKEAGSGYKKIISSNYTSYNMSTLASLNSDAANMISNNILNDNAISASQCKLETSLPNFQSLNAAMQSENACSYACFNPATNALHLYDCSLSSNIPQSFFCTPVCHTDKKQLYYTRSNGFSDEALINNPSQFSIEVSNSDACVSRGISGAIASLRSSGHNDRVGKFCKQVVFESSVNGRQLLSFDASNVQFANQLNSASKSCWRPKSCTVPNFPQGFNINHKYDTWIGVFDTSTDSQESVRFTTNSSASGGVCANGEVQNVLTARNAFFVKLYCYDGTLYLVNNAGPFGFTASDSSTCNLSNVSTMEYINRLLFYAASDISVYTEVDIAAVSNNGIQVDNSYNRLSYYMSLPRLDQH